MRTVTWGVMGPGAIAHNFADALTAVPEARLAAVASTDAGRREAFAARYGIPRRHESYAALAADPEVEAVYVSVRHPLHAELSILALRHGKAVLCEKPAGLTAAEVEAVVEVARQEGRFWAEAFMYRCHPQVARVLDLIGDGAIGEVVHVRSAFGWASTFEATSRIHDPAQGGGAILDVGTYPASLARLIAGAAAGKAFADPVEVAGVGRLYAQDGVDAEAHALLRFPSGLVADVACSVARALDDSATITGTTGAIVIDDPWVPGRDAGPSDATIRLRRNGEESVETMSHPEQLFVFEARMATTAVAEGALEAPPPAATHADSLGNARTLDRWRAAVGYEVATERRGGPRPLPGVLPRGLPAIGAAEVPGGRAVSRLVMGCDNRETLAEGAVVWDAYWEAGGRSFDTAFVYGAGHHEKVLGDWLAARGVAAEASVIVKGAHTPYCLPGAIGSQLDASLDRLGLDAAPLYVMHRDNPDVPVGEFVDAIDGLRRAGRIKGPWGGSNWSPDRLRAAQVYARGAGKEPPRILNNNLSLAVMERPVWPGCISSNDPETLAWLGEGGTAHLSWSSQARGYFLPASLRDRLPPDTSPETCFGSPANAERRRRAEALAAERRTTANAVALAWTLQQPFPSIALIGPRSAGELASTLPALAVELTPAERAWLNLEAEAR